mgnify:FL=1
MASNIDQNRAKNYNTSGLNPKYMDMQGNQADPEAKYGIGDAKQYLYGQKKEGMLKIPLGGGRRGGEKVGFARDDYNRQMALMDKIGEMSAGYSTYGTLGDTVVDYEGKKVTQTLSPELQAQYDALLGRSALSQSKVSDLDPIALQQYIYDQNLALKQPAQEDLRTQTMESLAAKGMLGSTGGAGLSVSYTHLTLPTILRV